MTPRTTLTSCVLTAALVLPTTLTAVAGTPTAAETAHSPQAVETAETLTKTSTKTRALTPA